MKQCDKQTDLFAKPVSVAEALEYLDGLADGRWTKITPNGVHFYVYHPDDRARHITVAVRRKAVETFGEMIARSVDKAKLAVVAGEWKSYFQPPQPCKACGRTSYIPRKKDGLCRECLDSMASNGEANVQELDTLQ